MEILTQHIHTFKALDGKLFKTEKECKDYEKSLPKHLRYCLRHNIKIDDLNEEGLFEVGYKTEFSTTEYQPGGFLREGGDVTTWHSNDTVLWLVSGAMTEIIYVACEKPKWWNASGKFVRKVNVLSLKDFEKS